ncbi:arginine--tRNA ligase [Nocardia cyriacigeorgica]|uniref:Arginine--tRNA ligase n=1 Tax=Nocardia cyriacigeorgica TaxID=135487 RepID=A0A5R8P4L4_9NOCA|nr:arginine--tRNA ligase [Nocardia cyriacigeorgica]TLF92460.1 arginine--tRNA ligase [Nocardia cyriacigeorgica]
MTRPHVRLLTRDHPGLNPYLHGLDIPRGAPVYWYPDGRLIRFTGSGSAQRIPVRTSSLLEWVVQHEPEQLWNRWRTHLRDQRVLVEHTSINPVHPLHVGSMRGTVIGSTLAELFRSGGADVQTRYFVNDLGRQLHILQRALTAARQDNIPTELRFDDTIGVLYAYANMALAARTADMGRLISAHPWLPTVVDVHRPLPEAMSASDVVEAMVAAAVSDMGLLGAKIDIFDRETDLSIDPATLVAALTDHCDVVRINGTTCLRLPSGLVPVQRRDGTLLYLSRDIANTHRRQPSAWSAILHVIGAEQTLLQTALRTAVPDAPLEHIAVGKVSHAGRHYSARQNRLTTMGDLLRDGGPRRIHELALAMALRRRTHPIDIAHLDTAKPLQTVLTATHAVHRAGQFPNQRLLRHLIIAILATPAILARDVDHRTIHRTAQHLTRLSQRYTIAVRSGTVPDDISEWFHHTQTRLATLLGITLDTLS